MSHEELSNLALLSIEKQRAQNLNFRKVIQQFASAKATRKFSIKLRLCDLQGVVADRFAFLIGNCWVTLFDYFFS